MKIQVLTLTLSAFVAVGLATANPQSDPGQAEHSQAAGQDGAPPNGGGHWQGRRPDPNQQVKRLTKELKLTSDQQSQILPILTDRASKVDAIRADTSLTQDDRRSKMKSLREESETKIKAILTDEQKQKYDQMQQHMRERMQEHQGNQ